MSQISSQSESSLASVSAPGKISFCEGVLKLLHSDAELDQRITVRIMEKPLGGAFGWFARRNRRNGHGLIGKHDFVLLEYAPNKWLRAEKVGETRKGEADAGIHLSLPSPELARNEEIGVRYNREIRLGPGLEKWTVKKMIQILTNHDPNYDLFAENCWKYAFSSVEALLGWFIANAADDGVRATLEQDHLENLKEVERVMPNEIVKAFMHPSRPESVDVKAKFKKKVDRTREELPDDSNIRRVVTGAVSKILGPSSKNQLQGEGAGKKAL